MSDKPLRDALKATVEGLLEQIPVQEPGGLRFFHHEETSFVHLRWMADHLLANMDVFPTDKTSRWIGFIQGVMTTKGALDVKSERDRTRPLFHEAYREIGLEIPESAER